MKVLLYLAVISSSYGCFSKWFGKKDDEEKPISRDAFIPQTETTKKVPVPPTARQRNSNRNRGPVDIGTYRDQSDNRFMSQDVNNYTQVNNCPLDVNISFLRYLYILKTMEQ